MQIACPDLTHAQPRISYLSQNSRFTTYPVGIRTNLRTALQQKATWMAKGIRTSVRSIGDWPCLRHELSRSRPSAQAMRLFVHIGSCLEFRRRCRRRNPCRRHSRIYPCNFRAVGPSFGHFRQARTVFIGGSLNYQQVWSTPMAVYQYWLRESSQGSSARTETK
jgi:hypothetical protein